ncbi:MAG: methyltransferase domain-containing protein [Alphaproteobacteria bacterium]|nr:MAG: methyltransferase domain-containing protein [Alphaproteobacteria bacterium]
MTKDVGRSKHSDGGKGVPGPFDRAVLRQRRLRAAPRFTDHDFLFREIATRLDERLSEITRSFNRVLVIGNQGGIAADLAARRYGQAEVVRTDLDRGLLRCGAGRAVVADDEALPFADGAFDLAISLLGLHWVNDLPGTLIQLRRALRPDGLLLAAFLGGETLRELRQAFLEAETAVEGGVSPRVSPFVDVRTAGSLLQRAGFALPMVDVDSLTVTYENAFALMRDLRGMGETNALIDRRRSLSRRDTVFAMAEVYAARHAGADGRIPATFDVLYLTAWSPHESQPRPLAPGSARTSLGDVLGKKTDD